MLADGPRKESRPLAHAKQSGDRTFAEGRFKRSFGLLRNSAAKFAVPSGSTKKYLSQHRRRLFENGKDRRSDCSIREVPLDGARFRGGASRSGQCAAKKRQIPRCRRAL